MGVDQDEDGASARPRAIEADADLVVGDDDAARERAVGVRAVRQRRCVEPAVDDARCRAERTGRTASMTQRPPSRGCVREEAALRQERDAGAPARKKNDQRARVSAWPTPRVRARRSAPKSGTASHEREQAVASDVGFVRIDDREEQRRRCTPTTEHERRAPIASPRRDQRRRRAAAIANVPNCSPMPPKKRPERVLSVHRIERGQKKVRRAAIPFRSTSRTSPAGVLGSL